MNKSIGQQQVLSRSIWRHEALYMLKKYCNIMKKNGKEFAFEDFRQWALQNGLDHPHHHNAWGAITAVAAREKMITFTGKYHTAISIKTRAHPVKIWRAA